MAIVQYIGRANQTKLHQQLSLAPFSWIGNKATRKGIRFASEFHVFFDYIVDAAVFLTFQWRFAESYPGYMVKKENHVIYGDVACFFEAKQSRADFRNDFSPGKYKGLNPKGSLNWVVTPKALVAESEIPEAWGLLELRGNGLREIKKPKYFNLPEQEIHRLGYEMLWKEKRASQIEDRREVMGREVLI